jgi:hypothetical protein
MSDQSGPLTSAGVLIPDHESLKRALNERRIGLKLRMLDLDVDANLQTGYAAKMFCGARNFGPTTLWPVIEALGLQMVLIPASPGTLKTPFEINAVDSFVQKRRKNISSLGGKARRAAMSGPEWAAHCSKASRARWRKARMKKIKADNFKGKRAPATMRSARTRNKNEAAMVIWQLLIVGGSIAPPVGAHGFLTGPGWAGLTGSMF